MCNERIAGLVRTNAFDEKVRLSMIFVDKL